MLERRGCNLNLSFGAFNNNIRIKFLDDRQESSPVLNRLTILGKYSFLHKTQRSRDNSSAGFRRVSLSTVEQLY